jgi:hypothetical protein
VAPPVVSATWVSGVTATSAALHARVDPEGLATTLRFEYISGAAYQANLAAGRAAFSGAAAAPAGVGVPLGSGEAFVESLQHVGTLTPATEYRFRAVATNSLESTVGPERSLLTHESSPSFALPDHRGWELVSPPEKDGGAIQGAGGNFGGDVLQAAAGGGAVTYSSASSFGPGAQGAPAASQYISRHGGAGWSTEDVTGATVSGAYGDAPEGVPYQLFSPDLARGLLFDGRRCGEAEICPRSYSLRDDEDGALAPSPEAPGLRFEGATPDLAHLVLSTCAALTPQATEVPSGGGGCEAAATNLYEWSGGPLTLVNEPAEHGAHLAAQAGAISADGRRVYFTTGEDAELLLREGEIVKPVSTVPAVRFQTASADGSVAFYTKAGELFRYEAITGTSEPIAAEVSGVLGASADGSHVYYASAAGLFLWDAGTTSEVAPGAEAAAPGDYPPTTGTARVSADGSRLAFLSRASLTGYENVGQEEVYLYDAEAAGGAGELICASCDPSGERPLGPSTIPGAVPNGSGPDATDSYRPRVLSASGTRLFFDSSDALALQDTNGEPDVYEWEADGTGSCAEPSGCIGLISSGRSEDGASFLDASESGADAFFLTDGSLVPSDPGSVDVYDAREGGGFAEAPAPLPCDGDACQPLPSPPEDPTPGTLSAGLGNPPLHLSKAAQKKKKKHHRRRGHHRHPHSSGHKSRSKPRRSK